MGTSSAYIASLLYSCETETEKWRQVWIRSTQLYKLNIATQVSQSVINLKTLSQLLLATVTQLPR